MSLRELLAVLGEIEGTLLIYGGERGPSGPPDADRNGPQRRTSLRAFWTPCSRSEMLSYVLHRR
jgi:hypothetical protein